MRTLKWVLKNFAAGAVMGIGVLAVALAVPPIYAAALSQVTGPAGTNPVADASKGSISDFNNIINGVNANAAWAGTGTPLAIVGAQLTSTTSVFGSSGQTTTISMLQLLNSITTTTTTVSTAGCFATGATECMRVIDNAGNFRWLPLY
jgi:hypothetical protein